jgi:hypothetical protein
MYDKLLALASPVPHLEDPGIDWRIYNINIDFQEVEWGSMDWIDLAQDRDAWRPL